MSPVYHLHPEFGLLCPSWRLRHKAWVTLAFLTFLAIVCALAIKVGHDPDTDGTLVIAQDEAARTDARTVQTAGQATTATLAETSAAPEGSATACGGDQSSNIGMKCSVGRARKLQRPRAANEAAIIAALPLGRTAVPEPASAAAPLNAEDAVNTNVATLAVADLTGPERSRRCENRPVGMVAICRASGDGVMTDGALTPTLCPTTATCAVPTNGHGAGPGEARWRDREPRLERFATTS